MTAEIYTKEMILAKIDAYNPENDNSDDELYPVRLFEWNLMKVYLERSSESMELTQVFVIGVQWCYIFMLEGFLDILTSLINKTRYENTVNVNMERLWNEHRALMLVFTDAMATSHRCRIELRRQLDDKMDHINELLHTEPSSALLHFNESADEQHPLGFHIRAPRD